MIKLESYSWYTHRNSTDVAIKVLSTSNKEIIVEWYNIVGGKRKYSLGLEEIESHNFNDGWQKSNWLENLPEMYLR